PWPRAALGAAGRPPPRALRDPGLRRGRRGGRVGRQRARGRRPPRLARARLGAGLRLVAGRGRPRRDPPAARGRPRPPQCRERDPPGATVGRRRVERRRDLRRIGPQGPPQAAAVHRGGARGGGRARVGAVPPDRGRRSPRPLRLAAARRPQSRLTSAGRRRGGGTRGPAAGAARIMAASPSPEPPMSVPVRGAPVHLDPPGPAPAARGRFGEFGGRFVPETLVPALQDLEREFRAAWASDAFRREFADLLSGYAGRPTPVTECARLSDRLGVRVLLKREDLTHTGSHKINNVLGQALLTR